MKEKPFEILLVEDNPDHAKLVLRSFKENQLACTIHHVTDGEMALDYLHQRGAYAESANCPRPHVVLLDLRIPKVDGLEVLRVIKTSEELRRIPVVILTTSEAEADLGRAYDGYANSYLVKPVDFESFIHLMHNLGFYWLTYNRQA